MSVFLPNLTMLV